MDSSRVSKAKELYESGMTLMEVGKEMGVTHSTIQKWFKRYDIKMRSIKQATELRIGGKLDEEKIVELYNAGWLMKDIAPEVGYDKTSISNLLRRTKLEITRPEHSTNTKHTIKNKDFLYHQYVTLEKSKEQIAKEFGGSSHMVMRFLKKFDIPIRSQGESLMLAYKNGYVSIPIQDNPRGKGQWVEVNGEETYMRSSWEVLAKNYLDKYGYRYKYEEVRFDLGRYTYTPDFFIYDENDNLEAIIEVKGWLKDKSATKMLTFLELYPYIDYYVWDEVVIKEIKKEIKEEVA